MRLLSAVILIVALVLCQSIQSQEPKPQQPAIITFKVYYLQGEPLFDAFLKKNDQDQASLNVREALKQAGFKVRVSYQGFDENQVPIQGESGSKFFDLKVTGDQAEFFEGNTKTAIFVTFTPKKKTFYTLTIDAPALANQSVPEGQSVLEPVVLRKLHIEKMDISVVMPVAKKPQSPWVLVAPCEVHHEPCRLFGGWRLCRGR